MEAFRNWVRKVCGFLALYSVAQNPGSKQDLLNSEKKTPGTKDCLGPETTQEVSVRLKLGTSWSLWNTKG